MTDTHHPRIRSLRTLIRPRSVGLVLAALTCACASDGPAGAKTDTDRALFIATYVDLRIAALETETRLLTDDARDEVLARHAVTEESLTAFAELHGRDVEFMSAVWAEVELRLDATRPDRLEDPG